MAKIIPIVEGQGETEAVPVLLRMILGDMGRWDIGIGRPKNAHSCGNLLKPQGLERFVHLALGEPDCGAVVVLIDADKECAVELAQDLSSRARAVQPSSSVVVVVAKCEYEAWFLASLSTIAGACGLPEGLTYDSPVEDRVGVKGWLNRQMPSGQIYKETTDQAPMTSRLDTTLARQNSRSFRRMWHAIEEAVTAIDGGNVVITPSPTNV